MLDADVEVDRRESPSAPVSRWLPAGGWPCWPIGRGEDHVARGHPGPGRPAPGPYLPGRPGTDVDRSPGPRRAAVAAPGRSAPPGSGPVPPPVGAGQLCYAPSATPSAELSALASTLGIESLLSAMLARLSGGQAHRVALGRPLLTHRDTLLLDEPYTGPGTTLRRTLTTLVGSLVAERSIPAVLVAHELADAQAFADRLAIIDRGELLPIGEPNEIVLHPASPGARNWSATSASYQAEAR